MIFQPVFAEKPVDNARPARAKVGLEQKMHLDPSIKAGQTGKIKEIRAASDWANPYISVADDAVSVSWGKPRQHKTFRAAEDVEKFLVSLPVSAWPYGRIIGMAENSIGGLPGGRDYRKQSWQALAAAMKRLDVQINAWPSG